MEKELTVDQKKSLIAQAPEWVKVEPLNLDTNDENESDAVDYLLINEQFNLKEQTIFGRYAYRILDQNGVQDYSSIYLTYDPAYQKILFHSVNVIRDGQIIDKLQDSDIHILQQESELNSYIFTGRLSAYLVLEDIRENDVIEYSYSTQGFNPVYGGHFARTLPLEYSIPIRKQIYRLIADPEQKLFYQNHGKTLSPFITLTESDQEWTWSQENLRAYKRESEKPSWHVSYPFIEVSNFSSWKEVVETELKLYPTPLVESLPEGMKTLVTEWKEQYASKTDQALAALRFVQDKIRYWGVEGGIHSHQPRDPKVVFEKRFGDCKDKVQLLRAFLKLCDIESQPVLVHSELGKILDRFHPNSNLFNHVIIRIPIEDQVFYADATASSQGGPLDQLDHGNYHVGLILQEGQDQLTSIPLTTHSKIESLVTIILDAENESAADMQVVTDFYGFQADRARQRYKPSKQEDNTKRLYKFTKNFYDSIKSVNKIEVEDNREQNHFQLREFYHIDRFIESNKKGYPYFTIQPLSFYEFLNKNIDLTRTSPLEHEFPLVIEETIKVVQNRSDWPLKEMNESFEDEAMSCTMQFQCLDNLATATFTYKSLADHIPVDQLQQHQKILDEALDASTITVYLSKKKETQSIKTIDSSLSKIEFGAAWLVFIGIFVANKLIKRVLAP